MAILDKLTFAKELPKAAKPGAERISPVEKVKKAFIHEVVLQSRLANTPNYVEQILGKLGPNKGKVLRVRKPQPWFKKIREGDDWVCWITPKLFNKTFVLGGKRGTHIRCLDSELVPTLYVLKSWVESEESTETFAKTIAAHERAKKIRKRKSHPPVPAKSLGGQDNIPNGITPKMAPPTSEAAIPAAQTPTPQPSTAEPDPANL